MSDDTIPFSARMGRLDYAVLKQYAFVHKMPVRKYIVSILVDKVSILRKEGLEGVEIKEKDELFKPAVKNKNLKEI